MSSDSIVNDAHPEDEDEPMIHASHLSHKLRSLVGYSPKTLTAEIGRLASLSHHALKRELTPTDHIQKLPVELLAEIFTIGQAFELEKEAMPKSHLTAASVCQKWRTIVLGTTSLWRWITVDDRAPWTRTLAYLERAGQCPLEIKMNWAEDDDDGEDDAVVRTAEELGNVLDLLVPHVEHWRAFSLEASQYTLIYHALARLEHLSAPGLEEISFSHQDDAEVGTAFEPQELSHSFRLFSGGDETRKSLKKARFWGVHVHWDTPLFFQLTSLTLAYHPNDVRPSVEEFFAILSNSAPTLEEFTLEYSGPAGDDAVAGWPVESMSFPLLRYLKIAFIPAVYAQNLLVIIDAPDLDQLDLDLDEGDDTSTAAEWARVVEVICTGGYRETSSPRNTSRKRGVPLFPALNTLRLLAYPGDMLDLGILLYYHPEITSLTINFHWIPPDFINLLSTSINRISPDFHFELPRWVSQNLKESLTAPVADKEPWLLPKLAVFRAYKQDGTALRNLTEERRKGGIPLREMYYSDGSVMSKRDREYLTANLQKLEEFEDSEDGDDDEEDSEEEEEEAEEEEEEDEEVEEADDEEDNEDT